MTAGTAVANAAGDQPQFGLALTLGGGDVKLIELAGAYAVFANNGTYIPPTPYLKIRDGRGNILYDLQGADKPSSRARCAASSQAHSPAHPWPVENVSSFL